MRPALRWGLAGTVVLSALAWWWPRATPAVVQAAARVEGRTAADVGIRTSTAATDANPASLPSTIASWQIEPARRDLFAPVVPPPPPAAKAPVLPVVAVAAPVVAAPVVPPAPTAPAINLRYLGAMVTPEGKRLVMLARGETTFTVQEGTRLDEGYVVQSIGREAVRLFYAATNTVLDVPIPATPSEPR
jgi:hypothetical protein